MYFDKLTFGNRVPNKKCILKLLSCSMMIGVKILLTCFFFLPFSANGYNYDNTLAWNSEAPQCAGLRQSPISLEHSRATPMVIYPITFHNFNVPLAQPVNIANNGHTIELGIGKTVNGFHPFITGGGLDSVYQVEGVHFHWGSPQTKGSEHALGGQKYDLEMHIVCKNIKFSSLEEARNDPFGLAVMGVLFKQDQNQVATSGLNELLNLLPLLKNAFTEEPVTKSLTMGSLMGTLNPKKFYTYRGSLTTPPCSQAVTWLVFEDILPIETQLLQQFWKLIDNRGLPMVNNFRPLQKQNNRKIFSRKFFSYL